LHDLNRATFDPLTFSSDWERVIIEWAQGSDGNWVQNQALLSQHSGYGRFNWANIQNTFNTADGSLARGGDNGRQNLDHPKVRLLFERLEWTHSLV
jgi:hypothetical protein